MTTLPALLRRGPLRAVLVGSLVMIACDDDNNVVGTTFPTEPAVDVAATDAAYDTAGIDAAFYDPYYYDAAADGLWLYSLPVNGPLTPLAVLVRPAGAYPAPLGALLRGWGASFPTSCASINEAPDADGDGIPSTYAATFSCNGLVAGRNASVTGNVTVTDNNDAVPQSGASMQFTNFVVSVTTADGVTRTRTLNGNASLNIPGGAAVSQQLTENLSVSSPTQPTLNTTIAYNTTSSYVPANTAEPFAFGTVTLGGSYNVNVGGVATNITRQSQPSLHWNRSCREGTPAGSGFDSGTVAYTSDNGRDFQITFSGCTQRNVTFS